jgi:hypothetical protein
MVTSLTKKLPNDTTKLSKTQSGEKETKIMTIKIIMPFFMERAAQASQLQLKN